VPSSSRGPSNRAPNRRRVSPRRLWCRCPSQRRSHWRHRSR
jgi:hypothetical protein